MRFSRQFLRLLLLCFALSVLACEAIAADFIGQVVRVIDGDTIDVLHNGQAERVRLSGIDCPEKGQAFGKNAKQFTSNLAFGKEVTVSVHTYDRHGRAIADVFVGDRNLSHHLLTAGLAWWYRQYSKDEKLGKLEAEARALKRGLWRDPNPNPPWEVRHPRQKESTTLSAASAPRLSAPAHDPDSAPIIGNQKTHIYHRPDCPNYTATAPKNRILFSSPAEAELAGYRLAKNCP